MSFIRKTLIDHIVSSFLSKTCANRAYEIEEAIILTMKRHLIVIGMVGHKFCEKLTAQGGLEIFDITVFGEDPRSRFNSKVLRNRGGELHPPSLIEYEKIGLAFAPATIHHLNRDMIAIPCKTPFQLIRFQD